MTGSRFRKVAVHLTPLLDMTLIVFFAQYIEARQRSAADADAADRAQAQRDVTAAELSSLQAEYRGLQQTLDDLRQTETAMRAESADLRLRSAQAETNLDRALAQQRVLGELMIELFQIPPEALQEVLDPGRDPPVAASPEELARLRERFREMAQQDAGPMIRHLLSYEEIRKRCDVWELHVDQTGVASFNTGMQTFRIRVVPDEFERRFFDVYKSLPQPKGLVILLLTYDRASERRVTRPVQEMLPRIVDRMREDSGGRARFEYADLGVQVD
jgi:hypothetical protein